MLMIVAIGFYYQRGIVTTGKEKREGPMQALQLDTFHETAAHAIRALSALSNFTGSPEEIREIPIMRKLVAKMMRGEKLIFILPAFPAKSPSPHKTCGILPDLGEVLALQNLNHMCGEITGSYGPGAEVVICSDGRVFSDVVGVPDEHITAYAEGIDAIIKEFHLTHLKTFAMDDLHPGKEGDELRAELLKSFSVTTEEVREKAKMNPALFNGLHKFMVEDQSGLSTISKNQLSKLMKEKTYELMKRSDAWSGLLESYFPDSLRLSIHPYPLAHEKFGVKLVTSSEKWATPWHNVTVKSDQGFILMHKSRALELGARESKLGGKYAFFEL